MSTLGRKYEAACAHLSPNSFQESQSYMYDECIVKTVGFWKIPICIKLEHTTQEGDKRRTLNNDQHCQKQICHHQLQRHIVLPVQKMKMTNWSSMAHVIQHYKRWITSKYWLILWLKKFCTSTWLARTNYKKNAHIGKLFHIATKYYENIAPPEVIFNWR